MFSPKTITVTLGLVTVGATALIAGGCAIARDDEGTTASATRALEPAESADPEESASNEARDEARNEARGAHEPGEAEGEHDTGAAETEHDRGHHHRGTEVEVEVEVEVNGHDHHGHGD